MQGQALWEWFSMAGTRRLALGPRPFYHPVPAQLPARPAAPGLGLRGMGYLLSSPPLISDSGLILGKTKTKEGRGGG